MKKQFQKVKKKKKIVPPQPLPVPNPNNQKWVFITIMSYTLRKPTTLKTEVQSSAMSMLL